MYPSIRVTPSARSRAAAAACLLALSPCGARAGGFEVEQSTHFLGMSLAGIAAGGPSISSIFWNPAAAASAERGLTVESGYSLVFSQVDLTVLEVGGASPPTGTAQSDIGRDALIGSSFATWRINERTVLGLSITSPWGLGVKPDNANWAGKPLTDTNKQISVNVTPSISYEIMRGVAIGAGVQLEYFDVLKQKTLTPVGTSNLAGDDFGIGFTVGLNFHPTSGTSIGLGFRSAIRHNVEGHVAIVGLAEAPAEADVDLPEKVTLSLRQSVSPAARLLGTVEWTNWSRLDVVPVVLQAPFAGLGAGQTVANLDFQWRDGWLFALGGEYDWSRDLTLRAGAAYEISPVGNPTTRPAQVPDGNRWYASIGASYDWSDSITLDFAYLHLFYENDDAFDRVPAPVLVPQDHFLGTADLSVDLISIGMKIKMGTP